MSNNAFTHLHLGNVHTCIFFTNRDFKCIGANSEGTLGQGDTINRGQDIGTLGDSLPFVDIFDSDSSDFVHAFASGALHNCAVIAPHYKAKCFGWNNRGQLGYGDQKSRGSAPGEMGIQLPYVLLANDDEKIIDITAGRVHTCISIISTKNLITSATTGRYVKCWGGNSFGQLGLGHTNSMGDDPNEMGNKLPAVQLGTTDRTTIQKIRAGWAHVCVLFGGADSKLSGQMKCFGQNNTGQLGYGDTGNRGTKPDQMGSNLKVIDLGSAAKVINFSSGSLYNCAYLQNESIKCWGSGNYGQIGIANVDAVGARPGDMGSALPVLDLGKNFNAKLISTSSTAFHTCAVSSDAKSVKCFGFALYGELGLENHENRGDGPDEMGDFLPSISLGNNITITEIALGGAHTCILTTERKVKCWGYNAIGQLGLGDTNNRGDEVKEMGNELPYAYLTSSRAPSRSPTKAPLLTPCSKIFDKSICADKIECGWYVKTVKGSKNIEKCVKRANCESIYQRSVCISDINSYFCYWDVTYNVCANQKI